MKIMNEFSLGCCVESNEWAANSVCKDFLIEVKFHTDEC